MLKKYHLTLPCFLPDSVAQLRATWVTWESPLTAAASASSNQSHVPWVLPSIESALPMWTLFSNPAATAPSRPPRIPPVALPASTSPYSSILHSSGQSHHSLAQKLCGFAQRLGTALITKLCGALLALSPIAPSSPVHTEPPPIPQGSWCFPTPSWTALLPHLHRVALQSFQDSTNAASSLKPSLTTFLPEGSELTLRPLSSQRFCIKGLEDILFLPLSRPVVSSQGAQTSLSSLSAKPHPLLLPPLWRQRLPLGEGSCLEISWILLTAQSRRRKRPRRLRSAGGVLTRRPSAGPEPRSVCRSARVCGWGRGTWQPPGLVAICSCSISLMSLFRIPRALLTGQRGGVQKTQRRSRASPLLLGET